MPTSITSSGITFDDATTLTTGVLPTANIANGAVTPAKLSGAQSGSAPIYGARAWVNFNGTGTVAIRGSGNVSSITDNGTGNYTVNFVTAMQDANYCVVLGGDNVQGTGNVITNTGNRANYTTTSVQISSTDSASLVIDDDSINVVIFR